MPNAIRQEGARIFAETFNEELRLDGDRRRIAPMPQSQVQELVEGDLSTGEPQIGIVAPISFAGQIALAVTVGYEASGTVYIVSPVTGEEVTRIEWTAGA